MRTQKSMSAAALWLSTFMVGFAIVTALLLITLFTPKPYGDLSRLGRVSDTQFGWQRNPPQVAPELLKGTPISEADVVIIGDSFSMTHRWQSVLAKGGVKVATSFWGGYGDAICDDFEDWLRQAGFQGKLVILQSVERLMAERLQNSLNCAKSVKPFEDKPGTFLEPLAERPGFSLNTGAPLTTGWATYFNTRRVMNAPGDMRADFHIIARNVTNGCEYFSHRFCNKALFFGEDDDKGELEPKHVEQMRTLTQRHAGLSIVWMVIPNKTTVYVKLTHSAAFAEQFKNSSLGPDLFAFTQANKGSMQDFYWGNDTHLSMHGQIALGEYMLPLIRQRLAQSAPKSP